MTTEQWDLLSAVWRDVIYFRQRDDRRLAAALEELAKQATALAKVEKRAHHQRKGKVLIGKVLIEVVS